MTICEWMALPLLLLCATLGVVERDYTEAMMAGCAMTWWALYMRQKRRAES